VASGLLPPDTPSGRRERGGGSCRAAGREGRNGWEQNAGRVGLQGGEGFRLGRVRASALGPVSLPKPGRGWWVETVRNNHVMDISLYHGGVLIEYECACESRRVRVCRVSACRTIVESGREREFVPPQPLVVWG
jgi:hypothetical protein